VLLFSTIWLHLLKEKSARQGSCEPLLPGESEWFLVVDRVAFPLEEHARSSLAEAAALLGDGLQSPAKFGSVRPGRPLPYLCSSGQWLYTAAVRSSDIRPRDGDSFPLGRLGGPFNASSMASGESRFSRVFSSSNQFRSPDPGEHLLRQSWSSIHRCWGCWHHARGTDWRSKRRPAAPSKP
jgi:hypothetical protein